MWPETIARRRSVSNRASVAMPTGADAITISPCPLLLPWPRLALLIRRILTTQWDAATWPTPKAELRRALELRRQMARAGWWN
jgi:hypothetical protein